MRFGNPVMAIHDAYAINMKAKEQGGSGGAPMDSSTRAFNQVKAGLIIKAVQEQPEHLSTILKYCYAPDGICQTSEANVLYIHLLADALRKTRAKKKLSERKIAELSVMAVKCLRNFQDAAVSGKSRISQREIVMATGRSSMTTAMEEQWNLLNGILWGYLDQAKVKVERVCEKECETIKDNRLEWLQARIDIAGVRLRDCLNFVNMANRTTHERLNTFTHHDADTLENQLDAVEKANQDQKVKKSA